MMEKELLLGDEKRAIEVLELQAGGNFYGIDINDIREILPYDKNPRKIPNSHPYIEGIIKPRDFIIPIIDLVSYLELEDVDNEYKEMLIVTSIKDLNIGFHVDNVNGIHRSNTEHVEKVGRKKLTTTVRNAIAGILNLNNIKIEILDLHYIIKDINSDVEL